MSETMDLIRNIILDECAYLAVERNRDRRTGLLNNLDVQIKFAEGDQLPYCNFRHEVMRFKDRLDDALLFIVHKYWRQRVLDLGIAWVRWCGVKCLVLDAEPYPKGNMDQIWKLAVAMPGNGRRISAQTMWAVQHSGQTYYHRILKNAKAMALEPYLTALNIGDTAIPGFWNLMMDETLKRKP